MRSLRPYVASVGLALLALLVAAAVLLVYRHVVGLGAERDVAVLAAESVTEVSAAIEAQMSESALVAASRREPLETTREISSASLASRVLARDSGAPVLDDASGGLVVTARYDVTPRPETVAERREAVVGYEVTPLELEATLAELAPPGHRLAVDGPQERVASTPTRVSGSAVTSSASFVPGSGTEWSVTVSGPAGRPPAVAWLLALLVVLSGIGAAAAIAVRQRASLRRRLELTGLQESSAVVARLAVVVQQTRELAEMLPTLATELAMALELRGLTLTRATPGGDRPLFGWGAPPVGGERAAGLQRVAAGQTVWLPLSRGGRTAARLWVVAGRDLDQYDVNTLVAVGDLVASALTNAEAFAQQRSLVERMQEIDELKSVFLATASHELRTPVVAIAGYASVLNEKWDALGSEQTRSLVGRVDRNAQRLSRMVEDLLDFSRLNGSHRLSEEHSTLELGQVVDEVLQEQVDLVHDHEVTYCCTSRLTVTGSRRALERVVTNLVGNAVKYTPTGTQVRVLVREYDGTAELIVEDDGPGILAADRERVFSRFYRGQGDEVTRTRGTGLGLAIVTEFATSMGGTIRLEESDSGGARFVVAFPLATATMPPERPAPEQPAGGPTTEVRHDHS